MTAILSKMVRLGLTNSDARPVRFFRYHAAAIRTGGTAVLLRKLTTLLLLFPAGLTAIIVWTMGPIILVRFGRLPSRAFGHFAANPEVYLCERDAGYHDGRAIYIFYLLTRPPNCQLSKMWKRTIHISPFPFFVALTHQLANRLPGGKRHTISWRPNADRDIHGLLAGTPAHISFTPEEEHLGQAALRGIGLPEGAPFVCFAARDAAYKDREYPDKDWGYQDYRDSSIHSCVPAAEELARRGHFAIRMGAVVKESLNTANPMIIDYATTYRSDFLDIFLGAKCQFALCPPTGLAAIPMVFRRPMARINFIPLEHAPTWNPEDLFIPKKLWLREEGRFMTFREIIESGAGRYLDTQDFEEMRVDVIENTPEEITNLAVEMDERLNGTWQTSDEDEELQRQFWSLFEPSDLNGVFLSRIGAQFLRENKELLD